MLTPVDWINVRHTTCIIVEPSTYLVCAKYMYNPQKSLAVIIISCSLVDTASKLPGQIYRRKHTIHSLFPYFYTFNNINVWKFCSSPTLLFVYHSYLGLPHTLEKLWEVEITLIFRYLYHRTSFNCTCLYFTQGWAIKRIVQYYVRKQHSKSGCLLKVYCLENVVTSYVLSNAVCIW